MFIVVVILLVVVVIGLIWSVLSGLAFIKLLKVILDTEKGIMVTIDDLIDCLICDENDDESTDDINREDELDFPNK